jgi:hypothetical protein
MKKAAKKFKGSDGKAIIIAARSSSSRALYWVCGFCDSIIALVSGSS